MKRIERRVVDAHKLVTRAAKDSNTAGQLFGMPIVANSRSQFIGFYEVITPNAIRNALARAKNIALLHSHDDGRVVATTQAGTMTAWYDEQLRAARFRADIANTTDGRDLLVSVARGDVTGMSFGFRANQDRFEVLPSGDILRTLLDIDVSEFSAVLQGAYSKPRISTNEDLRSALRNAPPDIRKRVLRDSDLDDSEDDRSVCQHEDDERSGITCRTCKQPVVDRSCGCQDQLLTEWRCDDCGLTVDPDADSDTDIDDDDTESERQLLTLLLKRSA